MAKIAVISKYPKFLHYLDDIKKFYPKDEIMVYLAHDDQSVLRYVTAAENNGCSAVVTGVFTRKLIENTSVLPVVNVEASYSDIISAYVRILSKAGKPSRLTIFLSNRNSLIREPELACKLSAVFGAEVSIQPFDDREDYEMQFRNLDPEADYVIAGEHSIDICKAMGIRNEFLQIGIGTMNVGVQEAINISDNILSERIKNARLNAILNSSKDGIIYVNNNKQIEIINPVAINFLHLNFAENVSLKKVLSKLNVLKESTLFTDGLFVNEKLTETPDGEKLLVTTTALEVNDRIAGVIVFLKGLNEIQAIEQKIRINSDPRGNTAKYHLADIIGTSPQITESKRLAKRFGMFSGNVLIYGESGTGKELFANAIHNASARAGGPFYALNCAALPLSILESELFGYSEGSFTGAKKEGKVGIFELAHGGTLFLDEISEMDLSCQSKLLRAIQEKEIRKVGDDKIIPVDVRIIAASNRNLFEEVENGHFREDLLYRLDVMSLIIPPLRERPDDIIVLLRHFIENFSNRYNIRLEFKFTEGAKKFLRGYSWRGNIRELQNFAERIFVYGYTDGLITESVVKKLLTNVSRLASSSPEKSLRQHAHEKSGNMSTVENRLILDAIEKFNGNKTKAAEYLGVSRTYIWRHINKMNELAASEDAERFETEYPAEHGE